MADRLGRRRVLLVGLAVFGLLSLGVVAVSNTGERIALRAPASRGDRCAVVPDCEFASRNFACEQTMRGCRPGAAGFAQGESMNIEKQNFS